MQSGRFHPRDAERQLCIPYFLAIRRSPAYWSNGARSIGKAIIIGLQKSMGTEWTWSDIYERLSASSQEIDAFTRTTKSFMTILHYGFGMAVSLLAPKSCTEGDGS